MLVVYMTIQSRCVVLLLRLHLDIDGAEGVADDHLPGRLRPFEQEFMDHGAFDQGGSAGANGADSGIGPVDPSL